MKILAIDLGGMSAKIALFKNEAIIQQWAIPTNKENIWGNIKDNLIDLTDDDYDIVSISMPGFIDHEKGKVILSGNLNLKNYDIVQNAAQHFKNKKIVALNDANAAALGEFWKGAGNEDESMIFYTIGTGIGGGIIINGNLIYGASGYAGELGHGGYFQNKYPCTCGLKHCVEPLSSATGIEKLLKENNYTISLKEAGIRLHQNDLKIKAIFQEALTPLAKHIATMQTALNVNSIIIGGGPSAIGEPLRKIIADLVEQYQLDFITKSTKIKLATTKNEAGIYGAAYWALKNNDQNFK